VLSGAGISTDSGIADFRGARGAWTLDPGAQHRNTYRAFLADPGLRASYWRSRYAHPWHAEPNAGHRAVASLAHSEIATTVVTQNTDGLQQRAGTPPDQVIELHGTMHVVMCVDCGHRQPTSAVLARIRAGQSVPDCLRCGGILKTASTMFGQTMDPQVYARAERAVLGCDLLLAVGTTLVVEPAGSLCATAIRAGAALVIANWDPTPYDGIAADIIRDPLSESLPRIAGQLRAGLSTAGAGAAVPPAETQAAATVTAILCGAADEAAALAALSHVPGLADDEARRQAARWLRATYPPRAGGPPPYWDDALPDARAEDLVARLASPRFLLRMLTDTDEEQDRRTLTVLSRAAAAHPDLTTCLAELLSVLPGLSPAAVEVALVGGNPAPLAAALVSLARTAALPAELLDLIPAGTTVLGEFPVLLAKSLVEAYEGRLAAHPGSAPRGLARMLVELAERSADLGRAAEALAAAERAAEVAAGLDDALDVRVRAAAALRRARKLARSRQ
jgi:NAD-dependent SIR2 family protein deacetylase